MDKFKFLLTHDYHLPPFKSYRYSLILAILFILLPNLFFLLSAWQLGLSRPLFNVDYLLASILFVVPQRFIKTLGVMVFLCACIIDIAMMTMQLFPFMDLAATLYFIPFLLKAPTRYLVIISIVSIYLMIMPYFLWKLSNKLSIRWVWSLVILFALMSYQLRATYYKEIPPEHFAQDNFFVAQSQLNLYIQHYGSEFIALTRTEPIIKPSQTDYATKHLQSPRNKKVLLIIAESWGAAREEHVQKALLANIYAQESNLDFIQEGKFEFAGATVQGELRELCQLNVSNGYAFSKVTDSAFINCLPNQFKNMGYQTSILHGASSQLYDRNYLYPKMGFQQMLFAEHLIDKKHCTAFNGVCDSELFDIVGNLFSKNTKAFVYWLTLTSHASYPEKDIFNHRLNCDQYQLVKGDICNNMMMHAQFFDGLAELIKKPEMKGVEVIVVGDHMPPIIGDVPLYKNLRWEEVSWLHFKVKN